MTTKARLTVEDVESFADRYYWAHPDDRKAIRLEFSSAIVELMQERYRLLGKLELAHVSLEAGFVESALSILRGP